MKTKTDIHLWVMWGYNYSDPKEWIYEIWGGCLADHLYNKFMYYYNEYGPDAVMNKFWVNLDGSNRTLLEDYVLNNYKG